MSEQPSSMLETPDIETSSEGYASRFQGAVGRYLLDVQERGVVGLLEDDGPPRRRRVLDVGGGHGQLAGPLAALGHAVTVVGSDATCAARVRAGPHGEEVEFTTGDLLDLPFEDRQFDAVVSVRLISHMKDWRRLVAELCRVADQTVIIDYPRLASLNGLSMLTFPVKRAIEKNTRTYRSFWNSEIRRAFAEHGFKPIRASPQFVVPMGVHRMLGGGETVRVLEEKLRALGVTRRIGNPVLLRLDRAKQTPRPRLEQRPADRAETRPVVAVTGATGFTGGALAARLAADGYSVRALARDPAKLDHAQGMEVIAGAFTDQGALDQFVAGADTVFHIAAMYRNEGSYEDFLAANYRSTQALLDTARKAGVRRFVYCSTIGVHGNVAETPADESAPFNPRDPYQETKLMAEQACREAMAAGDMEIVIIRPCAIYGPGDTRMLKIFKMVQKGMFLFVGNGRPNFHPVYIDDLVQAFMLAMTVPKAAGETFIIGAEHYLPLTDYIGAASRAVGAKPSTLRAPYGLMLTLARICEAICKPLGIQPPLHRRRLSFFKHNRAFSIEKAKTILGYRPHIDLEEGFRRTVAWYYDVGLLKPTRSN